MELLGEQSVLSVLGGFDVLYLQLYVTMFVDILFNVVTDVEGLFRFDETGV